MHLKVVLQGDELEVCCIACLLVDAVQMLQVWDVMLLVDQQWWCCSQTWWWSSRWMLELDA